MAKPIEGVSGNGAHTHMGVAAKLKTEGLGIFCSEGYEGELHDLWGSER